MWDLSKIDSYITNGIEESLHLDYKAADALGKSDGKKKEISKDVSSFANSDGGIIIYGVKEFSNPQKRHLPECVDPISRSSLSNKWLEQVINGTISPKIQNLIVTPVKSNLKNLDEVIYVVEIPKSDTAHQAKDKRYYRRYNFEAVYMEEYEIRELYFRSSKPKIEFVAPTFTFHSNQTRNLNGKFDSIEGMIFFHVKNTGKVPCRDYKVEIKIPKKLIHSNINSALNPISKNPKFLNDQDEYIFEVPSKSSIFPGEQNSRLTEARIRLSGNFYDTYLKESIQLIAYHDGGVQKQEFKISDIIRINSKILNKDDFQIYSGLKPKFKNR